MKRILLTATTLLLVASDIAAAQQTANPSDRQARPALQPVRPTQPARPTQPGRPQIQPPRPVTPVTPVRPQPPRPGTGGPQIQPPRPGTGGPQIQPPRPQPPRPQPVRPVRPLPPHRPGAGRPPQFRPIHGPVFRYPRGYNYRRWTIGLFLPRLFLASRYYYNDWYALGIGAPPSGYRWIRYGPDLLLVQTRTRRVVDVIYGAFY